MTEKEYLEIVELIEKNGEESLYTIDNDNNYVPKDNVPEIVKKYCAEQNEKNKVMQDLLKKMSADSEYLEKKLKD